MCRNLSPLLVATYTDHSFLSLESRPKSPDKTKDTEDTEIQVSDTGHIDPGNRARRDRK